MQPASDVQFNSNPLPGRKKTTPVSETAIPEPCLFEGSVFHKRFRPGLHRLRYSVFAFWVDPQHLRELARQQPLISYNRFNVFSIYDADFGIGAPLDSLEGLDAILGAAGEQRQLTAVRLLCYPRIFGYAFNPICIYYCYGGEGHLIALVYEVNNTFGERKRYTFLVNRSSEIQEACKFVELHGCTKEMHVSPFTPLSMRYQFRTRVPADRLSVSIRLFDSNGTMLTASFNATRQKMSTGRLFRNLLRYPLMTVKITGAIHWEALRLWIKKIPVYRHSKIIR